MASLVSERQIWPLPAPLATEKTVKSRLPIWRPIWNPGNGHSVFRRRVVINL